MDTGCMVILLESQFEWGEKEVWNGFYFDNDTIGHGLTQMNTDKKFISPAAR